MGQENTYEAISDSGDNSADVDVTFQAASPEDARSQAQGLLDEIGDGHTVAAVIDEQTGEETDF